MNILVVEDEPRVADFLRRGLKAEGWAVSHAADGETALGLLRDGQFDVVTLDVMLPGMSGLDVCRAMRARRDFTPVLMLTALDGTDERITGLRIGADDYLPKPFDFAELLARIEALARRARLRREAADDDGGLHFDPTSFRTTVDGREVDLTVKERELLVMFLANRSRVLSRERLLNTVWGLQEDPLTNVVDVTVARLRRKIAPHGERIATLRGTGYRFE